MNKACKIVTVLALLMPAAAQAAAPASAAAPAGTPLGVGEIVLSVLIGMLFLVIIALASVVYQLTRVYFNKTFKQGQATPPKSGAATGAAIIAGLMLLAGTATHAQDSTAVAKPAGTVRSLAGITGVNFYAFAYVLAAEVLVIIALVVILRMLLKLINYVPETAIEKVRKPKKDWLERLNKSVSKENEKLIMIDHDYDGIRELDNDLPPWWKWGFIATIVFSFIYGFYYHMGGGPLQQEEFENSVTRGNREVAAYLAANAGNIDESNVKLIDNQAELAEAKTIFGNTCAPCHAPDGGGVVGPNLTDAYWLHGGSVKDIFKTIKYGVPEKGMKSWKADFSPKQIAELASFVYSLRGTKPAAPKEKQGDLYQEGEAEKGTTATPANTEAGAKVDTKTPAAPPVGIKTDSIKQ